MAAVFSNPVQWILGCILILSSLGVILSKKPVHSSLSFLLTLLALAALYLQMSAQFIAVMQVLVYAGAILVIFMFVIILFQDAYLKIEKLPPNSTLWFLFAAGGAFLLGLVFLGSQIVGLKPAKATISEGFGTVQALGETLYVDFFFPFEAVIFLFLVALIGAVYAGKRGEE